MSAWLAKILQPIYKWIINYGIKKLWDYLYDYYSSWQAEQARSKKFKEIEKEFLEASNNPELTPEERMRAQEDAFKKLISDVNNIKP